MAHTSTRRLFKRKLHLHGYMYMDKASQGRTKRFFLVIAAPLCCQAFLALSLCVSATLLALSQLVQTSLVPSHTDSTRSQAGLADTYVRTYAGTQARTPVQ